MSEQVKEDNQKTVVSFIVGLLIGGLLVWAFSGNANDKPVEKTKEDTKEQTKTEETKTEETKTEETKAPAPAATLPVGNAAVTLGEQSAGSKVALDSATFPTKEGWVGVRDYNDGQLGGLLGVARFSAEQGLVPTQIILQRATVAGKMYAIVFYTESGDRKFNLANDVQVDKEFATFTAK